MQMVNKLFSKFIVLTALAVASLPAFAHGEESAGPHGGYIQMTGAWHTEVVPGDKAEFKVLLVDINFANPVVKDSGVSATVEHNGRTIAAKCNETDKSFVCKLPPGATLDAGQLTVEATRLGVKGKTSYALPLKLKNVHSAHHQN